MKQHVTVDQLPPVWFTLNCKKVFLAKGRNVPSNVRLCKIGQESNAYLVEDWPAFLKHNGKEANSLVCSTYYDDEGNGQEIVCADIRNPENEQKLLKCWVLEEDARVDLIDRMFCTETNSHYDWTSEWSEEYLRVRRMFYGYNLHHPHEESIELMAEFADKIIDDWHERCDRYGLTEDDEVIWHCFDDFAYDYDEYKLTPPVLE